MAEFLHMGGYAAYVWSSYGLALIVLIPTMLLPFRDNKQLIRKIKAKYKREQSDLHRKQESD